jgi:ribose 1,5-bisphosphokinase PhnN
MRLRESILGQRLDSGRRGRESRETDRQRRLRRERWQEQDPGLFYFNLVGKSNAGI